MRIREKNCVQAMPEGESGRNALKNTVKKFIEKERGIFGDLAESNPEFRGEKAKELLRECINKNDTESLQLLLDNGMRSDCLIHAAIAKLRRACFDLLVTRRVGLDDRTAKGMTPLGFAASMKRIYFVNQLLANAADPSIPDDNGCLPIHYAAAVGADDIVASLMASGSPTLAMGSGKTPVAVAIERGNIAALSLMLRGGADPNGMSDERLPVEIALSKRQYGALVVLMACGADVRCLKEWGDAKANVMVLEWGVPVTHGMQSYAPEYEVDETFDTIKESVESFQKAMKKPDVLDGFASLILDEMHDIVIEITAYVISLQNRFVALKSRRLSLIQEQFRLLETSELNALNVCMAEEKDGLIAGVIRTYRKLKRVKDAGPAVQQLLEDMDTFEQGLASWDTPSESETPSLDVTDKRSELWLRNRDLVDLRRRLTSIHALVKSVEATVSRVLDSIENSLTRAASVVTTQLSYSRVFRPTAGEDPAVSAFSRRLSQDISHLANERTHFAQHCSYIFRLLRISMH